MRDVLVCACDYVCACVCHGIRIHEKLDLKARAAPGTVMDSLGNEKLKKDKILTAHDNKKPEKKKAARRAQCLRRTLMRIKPSPRLLWRVIMGLIEPKS